MSRGLNRDAGDGGRFGPLLVDGDVRAMDGLTDEHTAGDA